MASVRGSLDGTGLPRVDLQVVSPATNKTTSLTAIVDTGFTGFLLLPSALNETLELPRSKATTSYVLGDGRVLNLGHVRGTVLFGGKVLESRLIALAPFTPAIVIGSRFLQRSGFGLFIRRGQMILFDEDEPPEDLEKVVAAWLAPKWR
jgi:clan AA aspartic protease